ncbi:BrxA/BrxB family bacilliredoxin [Litoribacter ruber]|uniref:BrxA/BrxB family bacilliredoxin n=1 Tax=Litoribacter ruber TaxID=702568 RepID=A0AAP2CI57_9BACT|nr:MULTISPECIES: BrxA/BrxB family bacilliredoxin [Litoribacter]MBS9525183.1 BrxA/BrxB family bacilliredoxin [Litoribacter alkaliphilus]MBT0811669.1 BrxA/BrxB family bacilliredoxin [Litoribacter ruber]
MYPEELVAPMRSELTEVGFQEFRTADDVDNHLKSHKGTTFIVINSVCGCAAGAARPGVRSALEKSSKKPSTLATVFAGNDTEAVKKVREYTLPYPPSSPAMALFKDGELVHFLERHHIEGRNAQLIGDHLVEVFEHYC